MEKIIKDSTDLTATTIQWGIIGCGDVTEVKSGPAFNKVDHSQLIAVMRRDGAKAADYAKRHQVAYHYTNATDLINHPGINAIYVATPPVFHEAYVIEALRNGKYVYVEKPVTTSLGACKRIAEANEKYKGKLVVAHYRRALPLFLKIKSLLASNAIGKVKLIKIDFLQPDQSSLIAATSTNWRILPEISGGGLFFDIAPHQLDILIFLFGNQLSSIGMAANQAKLYQAEDAVVGVARFPDDILFSGNWCFTMPSNEQKDTCEIIGERGSIKFNFFFGNEIIVSNHLGEEKFAFERPEHIQQHMIQKVVNYFLGSTENPCSIEEATKSFEVMESFVQ